MKYPDDLVDTVSLILSDNCKYMVEINVFALTPDDDLIRYHHGLGTAIRNHYNLWDSKVEQLDEYGFPIHPDDISFEFIKEAQRLLRV